MKTQLLRFFILPTLLFSLAIITKPVLADQPTTFSGKVVVVKGQRLQIRTDDGKLIWATTPDKIPDNATGKKISGAYLQGGDIFRLTDLIFSEER